MDILNKIRERTQSLKMKDQAATDGESGSRYSCRVQKSSESSSSPNTKDNAAGKKWNIPRIPEGWQQSFGKAAFKLILDWRFAAHKGHTQQHGYISEADASQHILVSDTGNDQTLITRV